MKDMVKERPLYPMGTSTRDCTRTAKDMAWEHTSKHIEQRVEVKDFMTCLTFV